MPANYSSLRANPLARSPGKVKLDSDKWKLWKNLFEWIEKFSKFGCRASRWKKLRQRNYRYCAIYCHSYCEITLKLFASIRDVNRFWSSRQIDADGTAVRCAEPSTVWGPSVAPRSSGINGAKSCILGLSWHLISLLKLHFFCTIFLIFSAIVQDKRPFFTTFDYIVAVIQALRFVDYKDVLRFYFLNAIWLEKQNS